MRKYFGTDGVRGVANVELTPELAFQLGRAGGYVITKGSKNPTFVVGRDTRLSGEMLESALVAGLLSVGIQVVQVGVLPTPGVAYLTRELQTNGGVMISASHNPFEDNGIKFFDGFGFKLKDEVELEIERLVEDGAEINRLSGAELGTFQTVVGTKEKYVKFLAKTATHDFKGLKVVVDCANGASSSVAEKLFTSLGAEVVVIHANPNGININVECGSTHPENLQEVVVKEKADIGVALDGDADRLIAVDHEGNIVDGDEVLYVLANSLKEKNMLRHNVVVSTVMSNFGFKKQLEEDGIETVQTQVGDRYVLEEMMEKGYVLGGEQSGHVVLLEHNTTGDGLLSAVQLIDEMKRTGKSLRELIQNFKKYPQLLVNVRVANKRGWEENAVIQEEIKRAEQELNGNGRVLVRASGTENLIRVMVEGESEDMVTQLTESIARVVESEMC